MGRLDGKVAIVTGGARGQGGAEATLFRAEGAEVVITDVLRDEGELLAKEIGATFLAHDVRSEEEWAEVVRQTLEQHGRVDVLVNNAGIFQRAKLMDTDLDLYRRIVDVNQIGVFLGMKAVAPAMTEQARLDRQHLVGRRAARLAGRLRLRRLQVRRHRHDEVGRPRARPPRHPGQLDPSRDDRDGHDDRGDRRQRRAPRPLRGIRADEAPRRTRRRSPSWRCSSPATTAATAPARSSSSTAA